jgi:Druantia protein DruA
VEPICVQGRTLTSDDLAGLRALIAQHPGWHRTALSRHLCELWNWRNGAGRLKDMAARTLLLKLQARGLLELPAPQTRTRRPCAQAPPSLPPELLSCAPAPIVGELRSLRPVSLELVLGAALRRRVGQMLRHYHYRGFHGPVGENVHYLAKDGRGRELAVMVFGAAAWKVASRDQFIGWSVRQRQQHLGGIVNQQRFLILPWVQVPHLASHLLALATRRLAADWQSRYGHPVWLVETFVECARFAGTAYKAAGWLPLGQTTGRTRQDGQRTIQSPIKSVWVRPLHPAFRQQLTTP